MAPRVSKLVQVFNVGKLKFGSTVNFACHQIPIHYLWWVILVLINYRQLLLYMLVPAAQNYGYWLQIFEENSLTDGHCLSPYTCKHCVVFKQFDELNFASLAGKHQNHQNFPSPPSKFCTIRWLQGQGEPEMESISQIIPYHAIPLVNNSLGRHNCLLLTILLDLNVLLRQIKDLSL